MKKFCIYTCLSGDYDSVSSVEKFRHKEIDFIIFTNQEIKKNNGWEKLEAINRAEGPSATNRYYKFNAPTEIPGYEVYTYIDASAKILRNPIELIEKVQKSRYDIVLHRHPNSKSIVDELTNCYSSRKISELDFIEYSKFISSLPSSTINNSRITENGVFYYKWNPATAAALKMTYELSLKYKRDQLTLPICLSNSNAKVKIINTFRSKSSFYFIKSHKNTNKSIKAKNTLLLAKAIIQNKLTPPSAITYGQF